MNDPPEFRRATLQTLAQACLDFIFPPRCPGCGRKGEVWCDRCQDRLQPAAGLGCALCGFDHVRRSCLARGDHPVRVCAFARYRPPLTKAILELKYRPNKAMARVMAGWLLILYRRYGWSAEVVVPVPLAFVRRRQRGYNQVDLIASPFAEALDLPLDRNALTRVRDTGSQVGLDHHARWINVEGAFTADPHHCRYKRVLLVDDLLTTGATILSCAQALYASGAKSVLALSVGRADGLKP